MQPMVTCHFLISPFLPLKMGGLIFSHTGYLVALSRKHCCYSNLLLGGLRGLLGLLCRILSRFCWSIFDFLDFKT